MWKGNIISKLKQIESTLFQRHDFLENADALSLTMIDSPDSSPLLHLNNLPQMIGLQKMVNELSTILNESHIEQQSLIAHLQKECQSCSEFLYNNSTAMKKFSAIPFVKEEEPGASSSDTTWNELPIAEDDDQPNKISSNQIYDNKRLVEMTNKQLFRRLQDCHDKLIAILDTKLCAHEVITSCMENYIHLLSDMARAAGVTNAVWRVQYVVKPLATTLLAHRFLETKETHDVLQLSETIVAQHFFAGNNHLAERCLVTEHSAGRRVSYDWRTFLKMGAGAVLALWAFSECFNNESSGREIWHDPTFAIFMCLGDLLLLLWMWGLSIQIWRSAGIDFVRLLHLEGTELELLRVPEHSVYSSASDLTLIFLVIFICFNKTMRGVFELPGSLSVAHALPVLMIVFIVYRIVTPYESRSKWLFMLGKVLAAPCFPVVFRDGYVGDLLTSLVRVLISICFSLAYLMMSALAWVSNNMSAASSTSDLWWQDSRIYKFGIIPFFTLFPLWIRLMQCLRRSVETGRRWPHMVNALKYTSAIAVISFGTFYPAVRNNRIWVLCFVLATLFQFTWDLTMDWGIVVSAGSSAASPESSFLGLALRETKLLGPTWIYVTVIVCNLVMRFAWTLTLLAASAADSSTLYGSLLYHLSPLIAAGEVVRRMVWGFFRLEFEQLESLGDPQMSSAFNTSGISTTSFEKMTVQSSVDIKSDNMSVTYYEELIAWLVTGLWPSLHVFGLHRASSKQSKARFVEAFVFAAAVFALIAYAASFSFKNR